MAAGLAVLAVALATCAVAAAPPVRAAAGCPAVTFIGARGSGQTDVGHDGVGPGVDEIAHVMQSALARRHLGMNIEYVHFPADSVNDFVPSKNEILIERTAGIGLFLAYWYEHNVSRFLHSIDQGVRDGIQRLRRTCPSSVVVLSGFSQGSMVMHQVEQQLAAAGNAGDVLDRVGATLLIADGDRVPYTHAVRLGTAAARGEGVRSWFYGNPLLRPLMQGFVARDYPLLGRTVSICNTGDIICDFNFNHVRSVARAKHAAGVHHSYAYGTSRGYRYSPLLARAARLAVGWVVQLHRERRTRNCSPPPSGPQRFPDIGALRAWLTTCVVARGVASGIQAYWKDNHALPPTVESKGREFTCTYRHIAHQPATDYYVAHCGWGNAVVTMDLGS